jgi:hypothetical protein
MEGFQREIESMADARMRAVCTRERQGEPHVIRKTWMNINEMAVTHECRNPGSGGAT